MIGFRSRKLLFAISCYCIFQIWHICVQAIVLAICLLVVEVFLSNNTSEGIGHNDVPVDYGFEIETLQLQAESMSAAHLERKPDSPASIRKPTDWRYVKFQKVEPPGTRDVNKPLIGIEPGAEGSSQEPRHQYNLRPRSGYLSQRQRAMVLAWLQGVKPAEIDLSLTSQAPTVTKTGTILPPTTRRQTQHRRGSNGGLRTSQAQIDVSARSKSSDPTNQRNMALTPFVSTSVTNGSDTARLPPSLIMSEAGKVTHPCSSKESGVTASTVLPIGTDPDGPS